MCVRDCVFTAVPCIDPLPSCLRQRKRVLVPLSSVVEASVLLFLSKGMSRMLQGSDGKFAGKPEMKSF